MLMLDAIKLNNAEILDNKHWSITSNDPANPWTIEVIKDAEHPETGTVWEWKVDGQYFDRDEWATKYLIKRIAEKVTHERIINRERGTVPIICGINGNCRAKHRGYFTILCSTCPVAEKMQADRDGVKLRYVI